MNTTLSCKVVRLVAGPAVAAGMITGALGLAAVANASTTSATDLHAPTTFQPHQNESLRQQRESGDPLQEELGSVTAEASSEGSSKLSNLKSQIQEAQQATAELEHLRSMQNQLKNPPPMPTSARQAS